MSLRRRITLVSAAAVAVAVVLASVITYVLVSDQLHRQVDSQLRARANDRRLAETVAEVRGNAVGGRHTGLGQLLAAGNPPPLFGTVARTGPTGVCGGPTGGTPNPLSNLSPRPGQVLNYDQVINSHGTVCFTNTNTRLPIDPATLALARHGGKPTFSDATAGGVHLRILAAALSSGYAIQFAQPLTADDNLLATLRLILALLDIGGIALAALLGRLVAGAAVTPVRRLTEAAEEVRRTQDLSLRIAPEGDDEVGRLAVSFNAMLDALESSMTRLDASVHAQRQLVADASHELRTPITSLRTNIEILQQMPGMDRQSRSRLLDDVVQQIEELTLLITDLIDLARGEAPREEFEEVRLDLLVRDSIARTQRHFTDVDFQTDLDETLVLASPGRLDRAVNNLLDNAAKYSPRGHPIEVRLRDGELSVRDHGPGIAPDDLPHAFDRFYRGAEARGRPGSGLGLAIVRQVVETHGGSVIAESAPGGGALMRLTLRPLDDGGPIDDGAVSLGDGAATGNGAIPHGDDAAPPGGDAGAEEAASQQSSPAAV